MMETFSMLVFIFAGPIIVVAYIAGMFHGLSANDSKIAGLKHRLDLLEEAEEFESDSSMCEHDWVDSRMGDRPSIGCVKCGTKRDGYWQVTQ